MTIMYYLKYTGIPINLGITTLLGFLVGTAIKAMGLSNERVAMMVLLQATVVGLLGYCLGIGSAAIFGLMTQGTELAFVGVHGAI
jgi:putative ABC transport system permease protein